MANEDYSREKIYGSRYKYACNHCGFEFFSTTGIGEKNMREHLSNCIKKNPGSDSKWARIRREADFLRKGQDK